MKRYLRFGLIGLLLVLMNCQIHNHKQLFNGQPKLVSNHFTFTEGPATDKSGNIYFTDQPNDKIFFGIGKPIKLSCSLIKQEGQTGLTLIRMIT
jgi:gluconolactonase